MVDPPKAGWHRIRPVLLTTLVPLAAALGILALAVYGHKSANIADEPSMAAFDACLTANNLQPAASYPSQFDETIAAQQEMKVCGSKIPQSVIRKAQNQRQAAESSYRECLHNLAGSSGGGFGGGRFRSGPSQSFRNAYATCQSLLGNGGGGEGSTPQKPAATPVAPVA
jgi:hypothetical protein